MAYEPPIAVYDACVLYPFHLRNLLVQCAVDRLVEARWTDDIHNEWIRSLSAHEPKIPIDRLHAARDLMNAALPTANVRGYRIHLPTISLPDADDRHVVAAAVAASASTIVTWNVRDFPAAELRKHYLQKQTPDAFLTHLYDQMPDLTVEAVANARRNLRRSLTSAEDFIQALRRQRLARFVAKIEPYISKL